MVKAYYVFKYVVPQEFFDAVTRPVSYPQVILGDVSICVPYDGGILVCVNSDSYEDLDYLLEDWKEYRT